MEQQAEAALATDLLCQECKGTKTKIVVKEDEASEIPCPSCNGVGTLRVLGNDKAIDRTLQMAGILGKDGGVSVSISNTVTTNNGVTPIEKMSSDIGTIIDVRPE
jgi:DnaJ-class molecular chaperone